jgi:uncharacterized SAM-binding protein YcdF (DUF218 family)
MFKKPVIWLIISVFIISVGILIASQAGVWLVAETDDENVDLIVVLMGSVPDRILEAVDLYHEGRSDKIVFVKSHMEGSEILLERGYEIPTDAHLSFDAAFGLGVPSEALEIIEGDAKSTQDEAILVKDYLEANPEIESILVVTSKYHSMRSHKIFSKMVKSLDQEVKVYSSSSRYDSFNPINLGIYGIGIYAERK